LPKEIEIKYAQVYLSIRQQAWDLKLRSLDGFLKEYLFQNNPSGKRENKVT
jgi:hypothetical protein